jgi:16S rRNA (cytosine1402-N4)-methyltransferase
LGPALDYLAIRSDGIYVDATFGAGGHSKAILERLSTGRLLAFDIDPVAQQGEAVADSRFELIRANFRDLCEELDRRGIASIDGILFDLGVSSMQVDDPERGFSLTKTAALDMRMDPYAERNAYDILASASERELADIFFHYGEERAAWQIARAVVERRSNGTLPTTTTEFAALVAGVLHRRGHRERLHPATRVFQALRITVNDELSALRDGLGAAIGRLRAAGRIVAISFHSLEDRIVKQTFRSDDRLDVLTPRPVVPSEEEITQNVRARSAKLRAAKRKVS